MLAMALFSAIFGALVFAYLAGIRTFSQESGRFDLFWEGYEFLDQFSDEIRQSLDVTQADPAEITFWYDDLNANGSIEVDELVKYSQVGQTIQRTQGSEVRVALKNVKQLSLAYDPESDPSLVTITVTMQKNGNVATLEAKSMKR